MKTQHVSTSNLLLDLDQRSFSFPISSAQLYNDGICFMNFHSTAICRAAKVRVPAIWQGVLCGVNLSTSGESEWRVCRLWLPVPAYGSKRAPINISIAQGRPHPTSCMQ